MPETKGQNFQDVQESALQVTGLPVRSTNEQILSALDQDKNQPLRLYESTTPDSLLNITASKFQMFNGVEKNVTPVNNVIPNFVATTINFQTQVVTGGTVNITWPASTVGQYRLLCFTLLSSGEIDATFSDEETTIGALPNPGSLFLSGGLPIGWITLECTNVLGYFKTAGSTTNIIENKVGSDSRIFLFGSGGGGSGTGTGQVNFLSQNISDYNAYDDGAVSTPVDGSGGSPTVVSVSEETSNPIDTTESVLNLKVSKTAANGQGEGISVDFTTRGEIDYASPQFITVEVKSSANYEDDDFGIYIYDKDNSTLITPNSPDVKASTLVSKQVFEFQTSPDADDYRLIFHCKTTNANAYDLTFTVKVGPTKKIVGTPVTDWEAYTPTFNTGFSIGSGGDALQEFSYIRVGDSIRIRGSFILGSSGQSMGTGDWSFSLPPGLSIDDSKITEEEDGWAYVGKAYLVGVSSFAYDYVILRNVATNTFKVYSTGGAAPAPVDASRPFTWLAGHRMQVEIGPIPIQGWGSNVKMADIDTNRTVACQVFLDSDQTITTQGGAGEQIDLDRVGIDTHGSWDNTNHWYVIPVTGYYFVHGHCWSSTFTTANIFASIWIDSVALANITLGSGTDERSEVSKMYYLTKGQKVIFGIWQNESTSETITSNAAGYSTNMSIHKIGSSEAVFASEIVYVNASTNAAQSIGTGETDIVYEDIEKDTHNAYNASTGEFTVPVTKAYNFSACIEQNFASFTAGHGLSIYINVDGTKVLQCYTRIQVTGTHAVQASLNKTLYLTKGQVVKITADSNVAGNLTSGAVRNNMSIHG